MANKKPKNANQSVETMKQQDRAAVNVDSTLAAK